MWSCTSAPLDKLCSNCGRSFPCGGGREPCWCDQVRLNESQLTTIGQTFRDCLCPACLQQIRDRKSTRLNSSHGYISYAVFCLKKKKKHNTQMQRYLKKTIHIIVISQNTRHLDS